MLTASVFLPEDDVVVRTESRTQGDATYETVGDNLPALPIVVLIDRNTASAAEILTAALADNAGAEVVGTRSYGKGVFQQEIGLSNGGALKLTIGEYFTPDGVNLAGRGIHPDVQARDDRRPSAMRRATGPSRSWRRSERKGESPRLAPLPRSAAGARARPAPRQGRGTRGRRSRRCSPSGSSGAALPRRSRSKRDAGGRCGRPQLSCRGAT